MFANFKTQTRSVATCSAFYLAVIVFVFIGLAPVDANARSYGQGDVPSSQGRATLDVKQGVVLDIQATQIEVQASNESRAAGGVIGGLLGAVVAGNSNLGWAGQAASGAVGAVIGDKVVTHVSSEMRDAVQVIVKLDNGQILAIVQEMNGIPVGVGDSVYLVGSHPAVRVVKATAVTSNSRKQ